MQLFQRKFAVTFTKIWELWVYPDYDLLYIQLTSKDGKLPLGLKSLYLFQIGESNGIEIWIFGATKGHSQLK